MGELDIVKGNVDAFFLIVMGCIVFLMQCGFAFLEAGSVRSKNTVNILIKNMLDALIGGVSYWAIGWGLSYGRGSSSFLGESDFFSYGLDPNNYPLWFFQFVFAATAATILSGAIAERVQFFAYFVYSIVITAWVYPVVTHWGWHGGTKGCMIEEFYGDVAYKTIAWIDCDEGTSGLKFQRGNESFDCLNECTTYGAGWLVDLGYNDFAGSGIVHLLGGVCALVGCYFIGPRRGRFTKDGTPIDMPGHSVPLAALGGFILLFGFLAFNGGSQLAIVNEGDAAAVGIAIVNTIIGGCGGGLTVLFLFKFALKGTWGNDGKWSFLLTLNGVLTGMVAQCAGCDEFAPWGALIVGMFGGAAFILIHTAMLKCRMDDPLDAVAVHGGGGITGVLLVPFFSIVDGGEDGKDQGGIFWYGSYSYAWTRFGINIAGLLAITAWSLVWSILIFGTLKYFDLLRVDTDTEFKGCDLVKHGESAYPVDAWVELQYEKKSRKTSNNAAPMMMGASSRGKDNKGYNDAFEMVPTTGKLFHSMSKNFSGFGGNPNATDEVDNKDSENK